MIAGGRAYLENMTSSVPGSVYASPFQHAAFDTPFGQLQVFADGDEVVRASGFGTPVEVSRHLGDLAAAGWVEAALPAVKAAVEQWLAGDAAALMKVPVSQPGGPFFQQVWQRMREIPQGETASYGELAAMAGNGKASRAAGSACARNAVAPFVPCHRVVQSGGALGSYGYGGPAIKAAMLDLEAAH